MAAHQRLYEYSCRACSLSSDEPESPLERHSVTCAFGIFRHLSIHNGLVLQLVAIIKEAGLPGDSITIELRGMRPLDDTRPGDLVALDIYGEGHHLVIDDVSFSSVWRNATVRGCSTVPGFAAAQREQPSLMLTGFTLTSCPPFCSYPAA